MNILGYLPMKRPDTRALRGRTYSVLDGLYCSLIPATTFSKEGGTRFSRYSSIQLSEPPVFSGSGWFVAVTLACLLPFAFLFAHLLPSVSCLRVCAGDWATFSRLKGHAWLGPPCSPLVKKDRKKKALSTSSILFLPPTYFVAMPLFYSVPAGSYPATGTSKACARAGLPVGFIPTKPQMVVHAPHLYGCYTKSTILLLWGGAARKAGRRCVRAFGSSFFWLYYAWRRGHGGEQPATVPRLHSGLS